MNYEQTLQFLYNQYPAFEREGQSAYKPGLDTTLKLAECYGNPQYKFNTIHIAGTNGKGSVSHFLAAILQKSGLKVGLYTSPHFTDFAERIKINGEKIPHSEVIKFVNDFRLRCNGIKPSFFELTTILAFHYFAEQKVDIVVVETGLGGRLDSTNIIKPKLCIITNVTLEHTQLLGDTVDKIAAEKAGIIKESTPVVVGEAFLEVRNVLEAHANNKNAPIIFATDKPDIRGVSVRNNILKIKSWHYDVVTLKHWGLYQVTNLNTVFVAVEELKKMNFNITRDNVIDAVTNVENITGLRGRWSIINNKPLVILDSCHNYAGVKTVIEQLKTYRYKTLRFVMGFMADKQIRLMLSIMPKRRAVYYFTQADSPRACPLSELQAISALENIRAQFINNVSNAYDKALSEANPSDVVVVCGSMYVVAEVLKHLENSKEE